MSTVGKKMVMAVTGAVMVAYLIAHVAGNLKFFQGAAAFDAYARWLHGFEPLLWMQRVVLLAALGLHIWAAATLTARTEPRRGLGGIAGAMRWGGLLLAVFVAYHVATMTGVHAAVVATFSRWPVAVFYVLAVLALGVHLWHGVWSGAQTMGWRLPRTAGAAVAVLICAGFLSIPLAVLSGWVSGK